MTEVGVIPVDWEVVQINDLALVKGGKRLPKGNFLQEEPTSQKYIRVSDMNDNGLDVTNILFVPEDCIDSIKSYRIYKDDIYISVAGTLGLVGTIPNELDGANLTENADKLTDISCSKNYLLHVLRSSLIQDIIKDKQTVGAQPKLALREIQLFQIPLPPTQTEQRAIATALSDTDALLSALDALLAKKALFKRGLMEGLLSGARRLGEFSGVWEETKLGDHLQMQVGAPFPSVYFNKKGIGKRLIKNRDLKSDDALTYYDGPYQEEYLVNNGDVLIGMDGDFLLCWWAKRQALLNQRIGRLIVNENDISLKFMYYALKKQLKDIEDLTAATTVKHLSHSDVENIEMPLPPLPEQRAIATVLGDLDAELSALRARRGKLSLLKAGMMEVLLSGGVRLV